MFGAEFIPTLLLDTSLDAEERMSREWVLALTCEGVEVSSVLLRVILLNDASMAATLTLMVFRRSSLLTKDEGFVSEVFPLNIISTCSVNSLAFFWSSFALCWTSRNSVSIAEKKVHFMLRVKRSFE